VLDTHPVLDVQEVETQESHVDPTNVPTIETRLGHRVPLLEMLIEDLLDRDT
jgi:hypothetical protein